MTDPERPDNRQQPKPRKSQLLKPETAAKKLAVYLPRDARVVSIESGDSG